jgi:AcrR family transcriptional regulator
MPGRQGSPATARAILDATRELLAQGGVQALTVEGVAALSGVAKTTIYRRWRSKEDLALAVLIDMVEQQAEPARGRGDTRSELVAFVGRAVRTLTSTLMGRVLQGLASDLAADPALAGAFRERVVGRRVAEVRWVLERRIDRGEIRPDADLDIAGEMLFGPVYYRLLFSGEPLDRRFAERVVDAFLASAAPVRPA